MATVSMTGERRFKIVSTGWQCEPWIEQTLASVEEQSVTDWHIQIVYDPSTDYGAEAIRAWCDRRDSRWRYTINTERRFAVRNQYEAIRCLDPADDDIVVWLDLDGDRFAHPDVLAHLADAYADGTTLLSYGSYTPIPDMGTSTMASPFPADVVASNGYRQHILSGRGTHFNHLRTMSGRVAKAIPVEQFQWPDGSWYQGGADYEFMVGGLELAGGRYQCLDEVTLLYNHANPYADNLTHPEESSRCTMDFLRRPPLEPLP